MPDKKTRNICVKVTEEQFKKIEDYCWEHRIKKAELMRKAIKTAMEENK